MSLRTLVVAAIALVFAMRTNLMAQKRQLERELRDEVLATDRFVDLGVELRVVTQDPAGDELIAGAPRMRLLRTHRFGGMLDTRATPPRIVARSASPLVWFCSEDQEQVLLHDGRPRGQLVYGSEGAGKTTVLAQWHYLQWLKRLGERREGLQTAPTNKRLGLVKAEIMKLWRPEWYRYVERKDFVGFELVPFGLDCSIRMVSTHRQSEAQGSPVQGFNSSWAGRDEMQDQVEVDDDIENRGRAAKGGGEEYDQLGTATAKDSTEWRTLRDRKVAGGGWLRRSLLITRSPFVSPAFIEAKRGTMSPREFRRRMGAEDLPPERAVYPCWERAQNLIRVPDIGWGDRGWEDVTRRELAPWGGNMCALLGHDPGSLFDVTLVLKAFITPDERIAQERERQLADRQRRQPIRIPPRWVVVDEITTEETTTEAHVRVLLERLVDRWQLQLRGVNGMLVPDAPRALVRADPYGNNDSKPDRSCYTVFRNAGITIHPAAYGAEGDKPGRVPKEAGIDVVNTLLCNARQERRLFVAMDDRGAPIAPKLVEAFESSERDTDGKAETQRKNVRDLSHWPAALRYALWVIERPRLQAMGATA